MRYTFQAEQWLPFPVETVFDFFANPENLPRLMPAWQRARIEELKLVPPPFRPGSDPFNPGPETIAAGKGTRMTISFLPFPHAPFRLPWDAEITDFEWDNHFCDVQHRGPFAYWKHCHRLEPQIRGALRGALLCDHVEYELPLGPLGDLAHRLLVRHQIEQIFHDRHRLTAELMSPVHAQP
jgi:ligand-binding SRPBCC domain-containing protein